MTQDEVKVPNFCSLSQERFFFADTLAKSMIVFAEIQSLASFEPLICVGLVAFHP